MEHIVYIWNNNGKTTYFVSYKDPVILIFKIESYLDCAIQNAVSRVEMCSPYAYLPRKKKQIGKGVRLMKIEQKSREVQRKEEELK